jgi:thymidine kinase
MFSGKSEELIRRLRRAEIARQRVQIFKHAIDARYDAASIVSHSQQSLPSVAVRSVEEILTQTRDVAEVVAVDEAQFFGDDLVEACDRLANQGKRVIVAGLDLDYRGLPFGPLPGLICRSEYVTKQLAICMVCGEPAGFTQRLTDSRDRIQVGASGMYEARCRRHFEAPARHRPAEAADRAADRTPGDTPGDNTGSGDPATGEAVADEAAAGDTPTPGGPEARPPRP